MFERGLMMERKAISDVVTSVLIILIVLAAIVLVWTFLKPLLYQASSEMRSTELTTNFAINPQYVSLSNDSLVRFQVRRDVGKSDVTGIIVSFVDSNGQIKTVKYNDSYAELDAKVYTVNYTQIGVKNLSRIYVNPVFKINGVDRVGRIKSEYIISGMEGAPNTPPAACTSGQTQACGVGACVGTQTCTSGVWGSCTGPSPGVENSVATCSDGIDNDCDGVSDCGDSSCNGIGSCVVAPSSYLLSLGVTGSGSGTVSSSPTGINNCGSSCSYMFSSASTVTLTASATSGTFSSWAGCDSPSGTTCTMTMNANKSVTATFNTAVATSIGNLPASLDRTGLVGYWRLNETGTATIVKDISGNGNNLRLRNSVYLGGSGWLASSKPQFGYNLGLGGSTSDYVQGPVKSLPLGDTPRTVTSWVKTTSCSSYLPYIAAFGNYNYGYGANVFGAYSGCQLGFFDPSTGWYTGSPISLQSGRWYFVAVSYAGSGGNIVFYLNGTNTYYITNRGGTGLNTQNSDLFVGAYTYNNGSSINSYFQGEIAELTLWNRTLTPPEVQSIYDATK
jgi:hypothetical protein